MREQFGGRRLRLNDYQRRRLAAKAQGLGRNLPGGGRHDRHASRLCRPGIANYRSKIRWQFKSTDPDDHARAPTFRSFGGFIWNKRTGTGAIAGSRVHYLIWDTRSPTGTIRSDSGGGRWIHPAPEWSLWKTIWREFLSRNWELIVAADFFTMEVWTRQDRQARASYLSVCNYTCRSIWKATVFELEAEK